MGLERCQRDMTGCFVRYKQENDRNPVLRHPHFNSLIFQPVCDYKSPYLYL